MGGRKDTALRGPRHALRGWRSSRARIR